MDIYPISFVKKFASIVTVSEQQKARPGSTAAHKTSTFYWIKLKPWSISSAARKWQITAEMAETAVLKEKSCLRNSKSRALSLMLTKGYRIGYGYDILKSLKIGYYILKISWSKKG
jgi:hypothetical protein